MKESAPFQVKMNRSYFHQCYLQFYMGRNIFEVYEFVVAVEMYFLHFMCSFKAHLVMVNEQARVHKSTPLTHLEHLLTCKKQKILINMVRNA